MRFCFRSVRTGDASACFFRRSAREVPVLTRVPFVPVELVRALKFASHG
jgi:hypothetical protein